MLDKESIELLKVYFECENCCHKWYAVMEKDDWQEIKAEKIFCPRCYYYKPARYFKIKSEIIKE